MAWEYWDSWNWGDTNWEQPMGSWQEHTQEPQAWGGRSEDDMPQLGKGRRTCKKGNDTTKGHAHVQEGNSHAQEPDSMCMYSDTVSGTAGNQGRGSTDLAFNVEGQDTAQARVQKWERGKA